jgi:MFS family permease
MSGIYVAAESWLNNAATNETRGKVLSAYMIAQTLGIIGAQGLLAPCDAGTSVLFVAMLFAGALVLQYPIGWLSDQRDRRKLIFGAASLGAASCALGWFVSGGLWPLLAAAFFAGGVTTPLYALYRMTQRSIVPVSRRSQTGLSFAINPADRHDIDAYEPEKSKKAGFCDS